MEVATFWIACGSAGAVVALAAINHRRKLRKYEFIPLLGVVALGPIGLVAAIFAACTAEDK